MSISASCQLFNNDQSLSVQICLVLHLFIFFSGLKQPQSTSKGTEQPSAVEVHVLEADNITGHGKTDDGEAVMNNVVTNTSKRDMHNSVMSTNSASRSKTKSNGKHDKLYKRKTKPLKDTFDAILSEKPFSEICSVEIEEISKIIDNAATSGSRRSSRKRKMTSRFKESDLLADMNLLNMHKSKCERKNDRKKTFDDIAGIDDSAIERKGNEGGETDKKEQTTEEVLEKCDKEMKDMTSNCEGTDAQTHANGKIMGFGEISDPVIHNESETEKMNAVTDETKRGLTEGLGNIEQSLSLEATSVFETREDQTKLEDVGSERLNDSVDESEEITEALVKVSNEKVEKLEMSEGNEEGISKDISEYMETLDDMDFDEEAEKNDAQLLSVKKTAGTRQVTSRKGKRRAQRSGGKTEPLSKRKDLRCETCGKVGTISMIRYHEKVHAGKINYHCDICNKGFTNRPSLRVSTCRKQAIHVLVFHPCSFGCFY